MKKNRIPASLIVAVILIGIIVGVLPPVLTGITGLWFITPVLAGLIVLGLFLSSRVLMILPGVLFMVSMIFTAFLTPLKLSDTQREKLSAMGNFLKAEVLWVRGNFSDAAVAYNQAQRLGLEHPWISYQLASSYTRSGDVYSGFQQLMWLRKEHPDFPQGLIQSDYAKLLVALENYEVAEREFWVAIRSHYSPAKTYYNFGVYHLQRGQLDESENKITKAHRLGFDRSSCSVLLGKIHENRREFDAAVELYRRAIRENSENIEAYTRLGLVLSRYRKNYTEADDVFKQGMKILNWIPVPNRRVAAEFLDAYGENYVGMNQLGKAEAMFQLAVNYDPNWLQSYFHLADVYVGKGEIPRAISVLETLLRVDPSNYSATRILERMTAPPADTAGAVAQ